MTKQEYYIVQFVSELCEVAHRGTKMLHFGKDEIQEGQQFTNKERLEQEWADLMAVAEIMEEEGLLDLFIVTREAVRKKKARVEKYLNHAWTKCGTVQGEYDNESRNT